MPAKDHAAWDRVPSLGGGPWLRTRGERVRARTRVVEGARAGRLSPEELRRGRVEMAGRIQAWMVPAGSWPLPPLYTEWYLVAPMLVAGLGTVAVSVTSLALSTDHWRRQRPMGAALTLGVVVLAAGVAMLWRRLGHSIPVARFRRGRCPDCGYDLSGCPSEPLLEESSMEAAEWVRLGPRHCPECGALWPMVPPAPVL